MLRRFALFALILPFLAAAFVAAAGEPADFKRPNVLLLLADDLRWDAVGALGGHLAARTPNMDALARRGFVFSNAYCMGSMVPAVCAPSRTMILTGRSLWRIPKPDDPAPPPSTPMLPRAFREAGYATMHCGKRGNSFRAAHAAFERNEELTDNDDPLRAANAADRAIDFIRGLDGARPFLLYWAPAVPHDPRNAPPEFMSRRDPEKIALPPDFMPEHPFDNGALEIRDELLAARPRRPEEMRRHLADYHAAIEYLDFQIGRIVETLLERGLLENTLIVLTSDQGLAVGGRHGLMGKQNLQEHVKPPLILAGPGVPWSRSDALVYLFDLFPTLCALTGIPAPEGLEGRSLVPVMTGAEPRVRPLLLGAYANVQRMIRDERWKMIEYRTGGAVRRRLFDLWADPLELGDLSAEAPAELERLVRSLAAEEIAWGAPE